MRFIFYENAEMVFINPLYPPVLGDFYGWGTPPDPQQDVSCASFSAVTLFVDYRSSYVLYLIQLPPIWAGFDLDCKRNAELQGIGHYLRNKALHQVKLFLGYLEDQLIVNLEDHLCL